MSFQLQGNGGVVAEVDGTAYRALRTTNRPMDTGAFGFYQYAQASGTIGANLAAGTGSAGHVFAARWGNSSKLGVITMLRLRFQCLTLFTANTLTDFGFDAFIVRSYTASHSGQTGATLTGNNCKTRTSMGTTLMTDIRIANTAALTSGTHTFDAQPFACSLGDSQRVNPAAATEEQYVNDPTLEWVANVANGEAPIVLAQDEGIVIRNRAVWPAAGTGVITVEMKWGEVAAY